MENNKKVGVRNICVLLLLTVVCGLVQVAYAAPDSTPPTVTFGTNGASGVSQADTSITVSDAGAGVNTKSLEYAWDTQNVSAPGSGWTAFTNGAELVKENVTGTFYLWVKAQDNAGNKGVAVSNAFSLVNTITVTKDDLTKTYVVTAHNVTLPVAVSAPIVMAAQSDEYALVIEHPVARLVIPAKVVKHDIFMNATDMLSLSIESVQNTDILNQIRTTDPAIVSIGDLCSFEMNVMRGTTVLQNLTTFSLPLEITIKNAIGFTVPAKTSVFNVIPVYDNAGTLKTVTSFYAGGKLDTKTHEMTFYTDHFSYYIIAERNVTFPDIAISWARNAIEILASRNIIKGSGGYFHPADDVKRVDFSVLMNNVLAKRPAAYSAIFSDITSNDYFSGHVLSLNTYGILDVRGGTVASPATFGVYNDPLTIFKEMTRAQAATFLANGYSYVKSFIPTLQDVAQTSVSYSDVVLNTSTTIDSIQTVSALGIMKGYPNGTFQPDKPITREEAAQIMYLFLQKTDGIATCYDSFPDVG